MGKDVVQPRLHNDRAIPTRAAISEVRGRRMSKESSIKEGGKKRRKKRPMARSGSSGITSQRPAIPSGIWIHVPVPNEEIKGREGIRVFINKAVKERTAFTIHRRYVKVGELIRPPSDCKRGR
jgi:hypothetical protein